jgi:hypothetical protein
MRDLTTDLWRLSARELAENIRSRRTAAVTAAASDLLHPTRQGPIPGRPAHRRLR